MTKVTTSIAAMLFSGLLFSAALIMPGEPVVKIALLVAAGTGLLILAYPELFFILFLLLRPVLDIFGKDALFAGLNASAMMTLASIFIGAMLLFREGNMEKIRQNELLWNANRFFITFLIVVCFSFFNTQNIVSTFADFMRLLSIIVFLNYAFVYHSDEKGFKFLMLLLFLSAITPTLIALMQSVGGLGKMNAGFLRVFGTFAHPNDLSQYLAVLVITGFYYLLQYKSGWTVRITTLVSLALFCICIQQTYTRNVWIGLSASIFVLGLQMKWHKQLLFYIFCIGLVLVFLPQLQSRFIDITESDPLRMNSWEWRIMVWSQTVNGILEHPFLGHGLGMYQHDFTFMAHNDYLRMAYETGILGLLSYLSFLGYLLFKTLKIIFIVKSRQVVCRFFTVLALLVLILLVGMADNLLRTTVVLIYLFTVMGALLNAQPSPTPD